MHKISVIIPVYNSEKYLSECIDSVVTQKYSDIEILLIDDGSTDNSGAICDSYAEKYQNIYSYHNVNSGPAFSRRFGVEKATGEYISFIDSDDWVGEDFLQILYDDATKCDADFVTALYTDVYTNAHTNGKRVECPCSLKEDITIEDDEFILQIHGTRNITTGPYPKLIKRKLFEGIDYHEDVTIGEDYCMVLQLMEKASKIRVLKGHIYYRRMHGGNISRQGYTDRHKKALDNYIEVRNRLISKYPQYETEIKGYHIEYELAVITAMCRNKNFDKTVIKKLSKDLRDNMGDIQKKCRLPLYYKICCILIGYVPWLFIALFRILHVLTGR